MPNTFEAARAEALFVSGLQCSAAPTADEVRDAVQATLRRLGVRGCAAQVAAEFGDHPELAVARMGWALTTVRKVYQSRSTEHPMAKAILRPRPLALAS